MKPANSFLIGTQLENAIRLITSSDEPRCAVAFLGDKAEKIFSKAGGAKIICNLASGSTNPAAVKALRRDRHEVMQNDRLHAKVYIGAGKAVVASANLSTNGLALVGTEQAHWIEAGSYCADLEEITRWFDGLWNGDGARPITPGDLHAAAERWKLRRSVRPTSPFLNFDVDAADTPLISWWNSADLRFNPLYGLDPTNPELLDESPLGEIYLVEDPVDVKLLSAGTWLLWWKRRANGSPDAQTKCGWFRAGPLKTDYAKHEDDKNWSNAIIDQSAGIPPPFDCADPLFNTVFRKVIVLDDFKELRTENYQGSFLEPRIKEMRQLWRVLKEVYTQEKKRAELAE